MRREPVFHLSEGRKSVKGLVAADCIRPAFTKSCLGMADAIRRHESPRHFPEARGEHDARHEKPYRQPAPDAHGTELEFHGKQHRNGQANHPVGEKSDQRGHPRIVQAAQHRHRTDLDAVEKLEHAHHNQQRRGEADHRFLVREERRHPATEQRKNQRAN